MSTTEQRQAGLQPGTGEQPDHGGGERNLTAAVRGYSERYWPYNRLMPSEEPIYVGRLFYLFGSLGVMSFVWLVLTGIILAVAGPYWWHNNKTGLFFNSLHFWGVQIFFFAIFVHFGSSMFTAAWRGGRGFTWLFGVLTFFVAVLTGLTGYVLQSSYDGQWIGQQAKDALNAVGLGPVLNLMSLDSIIGWHTTILPLLTALLLGLHLMWVRRHGVVPPVPAKGVGFEGEPEPVSRGGQLASQGPEAVDARIGGRANPPTPARMDAPPVGEEASR
jgi:ubiquinol-cytochrome c reductase cytochrome b subunit